MSVDHINFFFSCSHWHWYFFYKILSKSQSRRASSHLKPENNLISKIRVPLVFRASSNHLLNTCSKPVPSKASLIFPVVCFVCCILDKCLLSSVSLILLLCDLLLNLLFQLSVVVFLIYASLIWFFFQSAGTLLEFPVPFIFKFISFP